MKPDEAMVNLEVARYGLRTFREMYEGFGEAGGGIFDFSEWVDILLPGGVAGITRVLGPVYITSDKEWLDGTCEAKCLQEYSPNNFGYSFLKAMGMIDGPHRPHKSPDENCHCGIYATLTLQHLEHQYPQHSARIVTVIAAEGQTIIGDKGFRTEKAEVVAYWCKPDLLALCHKQFVEAQHYVNKYEMLRAFHLESGQPEWSPIWQKVVGGAV